MKKFILSLLAIFTVVFGAKAAEVVDVLNNEWTGVSGTNYTAVSGLTASSDAVYSVQCAGGNSAIQLRSNNNNSGVVTTTSGGIAIQIRVAWNSNTNAARVLQVYGSHTAYTSPADLYSADTQGTLIGEIGTTDTELDLGAEYEYIGIRSKSGAMYLDEVDITWSTGAANTVPKPVLTPSQSFYGSLEVSITSDLDVYYTVDGTDPTTESAKYEAPFSVRETTTVKAIAVDSESNSSSVAEATYTVIGKSTIAEAQAADNGTTVAIEGVVVAAGDAGCVIYDGTDYIYYYAVEANDITVGKRVAGVGALSTYGGAKQLPKGSLTVTGDEAVQHPEAWVLKPFQLDSIQASGKAPRRYATIEGVLTVNGKYYNIAVEGAETALASIVKPMAAEQEEIDAMDGKEVKVTGYLMYVNSKYVYFVATEVKEKKSNLTNPMFEDDEESNAIGVRTYAKDVTGTETAQAQEVSGWQLVSNGDARAAGTFVYGSEAFLGGEGYVAPPFSLFPDETKALGVLGVWQTDIQYTQDVYLTPGKYMLQVPVYNAGGTTAFVNNLIGAGNTFATTTQYPVGEWTVENIRFEVETEGFVTVSVGYKAGNAGSSGMPHLFIESAQIYGENDIEAAIASAEAAVEQFAANKKKADALATIDGYKIGEELFYYPQDAIDAAKAAVEQAQSIREIDAALADLNSKVNKPIAGQPYAVTLANANVNLSVAHESITVENRTAVYFTEVEGGWAIGSKIAATEAAGEVSEYIYYPNTNLWTLSSTGSLKYAYVISVNPVDTGYTLQGTNGRLLGVDSQDAGSKVWADKGPQNKTPGQYVWNITEWVEQVKHNVNVEPMDWGTVVADPTEGYEGDQITVTATPNEGYKIAGIEVRIEPADEGDFIPVETTPAAGANGVWTFTMPDDDVVVLVEFEEEGGPQDMTSLILNPAYLDRDAEGIATYEHWTYSENAWKARNYEDPMNLITYSGNAAYEVSQTIETVPAGLYKLTVHAFYRAGSFDDEKAKFVAGEEPEKYLTMYATVGDDTYSKKVMNLSEGASETQHTDSDRSIADTFALYVPDNAAAARQWYIDGEYVNEVLFNVFEDGQVTIGLSKEVGLQGDYSPIGAWTLTRLGDADETAATPDGGDEPGPAGELEPGVYYVRNAATGKYFGPGNNWGTHASLIDEQVYNTFAKLEDGTYTMETMVSNGGTNYYNSGEWMDGPAANFTITQVEDGLWSIALNGKYYAATDNGVLAPTEENIEGNEGALWMFITQEEIDAENAANLANATELNPVDATFLIKDPGFGRNRRDAQTAWNPSGVGNIGGPNNDVSNYCAEAYHNNFSITQTIANAPKGVYKLNAQGFYRQDGDANENLPVFFMNDETATFPVLSGGENSMAAAGESFSNGSYAAEPIFVQIDEEGALTVGARLENNTSVWAIWDNFKLTYYGPDATLESVQSVDLIEQLNALRQLAEEQKEEENVSPATKTALDAALAATETVEPKTTEAYKEAIATMTTPTEQAKKDINNKPAIDAMYSLMESTNVYTQEAYDTFKAAADDYLAAWEAGTLTETVVNPYAIQAWHFDNNYDDFLLSAWGQTDFNSALYINTWSVEGETDGTEFKVPFFEYWTGDTRSLGANTWTATVTGLVPGKQYTATAWTRVRRMDNNTDAPYGISFQIEGGEPVDLQSMSIVNNGPFFIAQLYAEGTADENGNLKIQFVIDQANNISWLSFQNVNYEKVAEVYSINYDQPENGWIQAPGDAFEGTQVVFYAGADQGKMIESVSVKDAEGNEVELIDYQSEEAEGGYAFIMPASNVTIEATVTDLKFEYSVTSKSGAFYETLPIEIDLDAILAAIGATEDTYTVYVEAPHTGRVEGLRGETDGWHNAEGEWAPWNDGSVYYVQDDPENARYIIVGGFPGATTGPAEFTTKLVYVNPTTQAEVPVYITLIYPAPKSVDDIEIGDVVATTSVNYELTEESYVEKVVSITEADVQNILAALELESLDDADVYGYNPTTGKLVAETSGFDGWRDANGDFANWTGNAQAPACVKFDNGVDYYCYNITGLTDQTISTYWAIANDTKAVLVKIDFIYGTGDAINEINVDDALNNGNVFDLTGRRVGNVVKGHIYIVNGKKFLVK